MLKLCGFRLSNYHNKVRIALLEKGVPFEEDAEIRPSQDEEGFRSHHLDDFLGDLLGRKRAIHAG